MRNSALPRNFPLRPDAEFATNTNAQLIVPKTVRRRIDSPAVLYKNVRSRSGRFLISLNSDNRACYRKIMLQNRNHGAMNPRSKFALSPAHDYI